MARLSINYKTKFSRRRKHPWNGNCTLEKNNVKIGIRFVFTIKFYGKNWRRKFTWLLVLATGDHVLQKLRSSSLTMPKESTATGVPSSEKLQGQNNHKYLQNRTQECRNKLQQWNQNNNKVNNTSHKLSSPQKFPGVCKGAEEQARELNLLEDWGREWWARGDLWEGGRKHSFLSLFPFLPPSKPLRRRESHKQVDQAILFKNVFSLSQKINKRYIFY